MVEVVVVVVVVVEDVDDVVGVVELDDDVEDVFGGANDLLVSVELLLFVDFVALLELVSIAVDDLLAGMVLFDVAAATVVNVAVGFFSSVVDKLLADDSVELVVAIKVLFNNSCDENGGGGNETPFFATIDRCPLDCPSA